MQENLGLKAVCINGIGDNIHGGADDIIMVALYKLHNPTAYANGGFVYPEYPLKNPMPEGTDPLTQYNELMEAVYKALTTDQTVNIWGHNVKGLDLPNTLCENLLYNNFIKLYGNTPKPINKPALKRYIEKYSHLIINQEEKYQILKAAEEL